MIQKYSIICCNLAKIFNTLEFMSILRLNENKFEENMIV